MASVRYILLWLLFAAVALGCGGDKPSESPTQKQAQTPTQTTSSQFVLAPSPSPIQQSEPLRTQPTPTAVNGRGINIHVTSPEGNAIKAATVAFYRPTSVLLPKPLSPIQAFTTDETGKAPIPEIRNAVLYVAVNKDGFSPHIRRLYIDEHLPSKNIDVILSRGNILEGVVVDTNRKPIPECTIGPLIPEVIAETEIPVIPLYTTTNENGEFVFNTLEPGTYTVQVNHPGYQACKKRYDVPQSRLEIVLVQGGSLFRGIVAGSRDGTGISGCDILIVGNNLMLHAVSRDDGTFEVGGAPAGKYYAEPIIDYVKVGHPVSFECDGTLPVVDIVLTVNQGITVSGTAINFFDGTPLPDIELELKDRVKTSRTITDTTGSFVFTSIVPDARITIKVISKNIVFPADGGTFTHTYTLDRYMPEDDITDIMLMLVGRYTIHGSVEGIPSEQPQDYRVRLSPLNDTLLEEKKLCPVTGEAAFVTHLLGPAQYSAVLIGPDGKAAGAPVEFDLTPNEYEYYLTLYSASPQQLVIRVLDHEGQPLPETSVVAIGITGKVRGVTDEQGEVLLATHDEKIEIEVYSTHYSELLTRTVDLPLSETVEFKFSMGDILTGTVLSSDGTPLEDARITYSWLDTETGLASRNTIRSKEEGKFRITDVRSDRIDELTCTAARPGSEIPGKTDSVSIRNIPLPQEEYVITVPVSRDIDITVYDPEGNLYTGPLTAIISSPRERMTTQIKTSMFEVQTIDGAFSLNLPSGKIYVIKAKAPTGETDTTEPIDLDNPPPAGVTLFLHHTATIEGYVTDAKTGKALAGIDIDLVLAETGGSQQRYRTRTDTEGSFMWSGLGDGVLEILCTGKTYKTAEKKLTIENGRIEEELPLRIALDSGTCSLEGTIINPDGIPVSDGAILLRKTDTMKHSPWEESAISTTEGRFRFDSLPPGSYLIIAETEGFHGTTGVNLSEGSAEDVVIHMNRLVLITGTIDNKDPRIREQPIVFSNTETGTNCVVTPEPDGSYTTRLPPGNYIVRVGETELSAAFTIEAGDEELELDLSF